MAPGNLFPAFIGSLGFARPSSEGDQAHRRYAIAPGGRLVSAQRQVHLRLRLNQEPTQRVIGMPFIEIALLTGQVDDLAQFLKGQVRGRLVQCVHKLSCPGIAALRFERLVDG